MNLRQIVLVLLALVVSAACALAHDPYEITSTIRLETNRTAVEIEMEFNTAMLLVGEPRSRDPAEQAALFEAKLLQLQQRAGRFFEVGGAGGVLVPGATNVTLGVENHVKFNLEFAPMHAGLKLKATALQVLGPQGPYGTSLTVLDMVNQKVLGQSVLFAATPTAEFGPVTAAADLAMAKEVTNPRTNPVADSQASPPPAKSAQARESFWGLFVLIFFGVVLLVLVRRWRATGG